MRELEIKKGKETHDLKDDKDLEKEDKHLEKQRKSHPTKTLT